MMSWSKRNVMSLSASYLSYDLCLLHLLYHLYLYVSSASSGSSVSVSICIFCIFWIICIYMSPLRSRRCICIYMYLSIHVGLSKSICGYDSFYPSVILLRLHWPISLQVSNLPLWIYPRKIYDIWYIYIYHKSISCPRKGNVQLPGPTFSRVGLRFQLLSESNIEKTHVSSWWIISLLENISQIGSFPQVGAKVDKYLDPLPTIFLYSWSQATTREWLGSSLIRSGTHWVSQV